MARVLLIESDIILAKNIKKVFDLAGHEAVWSRDPQTAVNEADVFTPESVIVDLMLAGRSGVEFLYEFRSYPEWQDLPVIIYSHITPEELSGSGFSQLNIAAYHYKPTTKLAELLASVEKLLQPTTV